MQESMKKKVDDTECKQRETVQAERDKSMDRGNRNRNRSRRAQTHFLI